MAPRTTVFIPTRNRKEQLEIAIKSVLSQSRTDFQLIVIDNASTDGTRFLCDLFSKKDRRFRYIRNEANIGAIGNFRKCFDSVDTPFFSILSDDDILLPNFLEEALERLEEYQREHDLFDRNVVAVDLRVPDRLIVRVNPGANLAKPVKAKGKDT